MRVDSAAETGTVEQRRALKKACADMEGVFMNFLLKSMRKTVTKSDLFGSGREEEMFQDMLDSEVCTKAAHTQSVGIADMLYRELAPQLGEKGQDAIHQAIDETRVLRAESNADEARGRMP